MNLHTKKEYIRININCADARLNCSILEINCVGFFFAYTLNHLIFTAAEHSFLGT